MYRYSHRRLSVRPSVRLSVTRLYYGKTNTGKITRSSPSIAHGPSFAGGKVHLEIRTLSPGVMASNQVGVETSIYIKL